MATSDPDPTIAESFASDAALIRTVRWRLVLWSGLSTLVVLAVLGVALYLVVARNLEATGINQLTSRSQQFAHFQDPRSGPGQGFSFGGGASGTFALIANDQGQAVGPGSFFMPSEFPIEAGINAARSSGVDIRTTVVAGTPDRKSVV